jgi:hypothetical protein
MLDNGVMPSECARDQKKGRGISAPATRQSSVLQLVLEVVGRKAPKCSAHYTWHSPDVNEKALQIALPREFFRRKGESSV